MINLLAILFLIGFLFYGLTPILPIGIFLTLDFYTFRKFVVVVFTRPGILSLLQDWIVHYFIGQFGVDELFIEHVFKRRLDIYIEKELD